MIDGFLLVDKPGEWTSHDVVAKVRRLAGQKKVGHAGTLDPMATGLVVVGLGRATRLLRFVQEMPKTYVARVQFGVATDSLDADGAILTRHPMPFEQAELEQVLPRFRGPIMQIPPMVSAVKVEGRRLYEIAREGKEIEREARAVEIYVLEVLEFGPSDYPVAVVRVECSKGTYIRTLADDIAQALGGRAHLSALRRVRNGLMSVDEAFTIEQLEEAETLPSMSLSDGLASFEAFQLDARTAVAVGNGMRLPQAMLGVEFEEGQIVRMIGPADTLVAMYQATGQLLVPEVVIG